MTRSAFAPLLALVLLAPSGRADEGRGMVLTRQAQSVLAAGDAAGALELLEDARMEWPGSPVVAHTRGDALFAQGSYRAALAEYAKGAAEPYAFRSFFNQGVALHALAEHDLAEAGVPLDPSGLSEDAPAGALIAAIDAALPVLGQSRAKFLEALASRSDAAGRESVAALNDRMDDLRAMREELERRQEEQESQDDEESGDDGESEQPEDPEEKEEQEQEQDEQGEGQDEAPPESDGGGSEQEQGRQPEPSEDDETEPAGAQPQVTRLTAQQLQELLDRLEDMEAHALALQRARQEAGRASPEKDW